MNLTRIAGIALIVEGILSLIFGFAFLGNASAEFDGIIALVAGGVSIYLGFGIIKGNQSARQFAIILIVFGLIGTCLTLTQIEGRIKKGRQAIRRFDILSYDQELAQRQASRPEANDPYWKNVYAKEDGEDGVFVLRRMKGSLKRLEDGKIQHYVKGSLDLGLLFLLLAAV
jgi:hypothetical protein